MGRQPTPTTQEAEQAGICKDCISFKPENRLPSGSACWSMRKATIDAGQCARKGAALLMPKKDTKKGPTGDREAFMPKS